MEASDDDDAVARHYLRYSDILAIKQMSLAEDHPVIQEVAELYDPWMYDLDKYAAHYADGTEEMYDGDRFRYEEGFENHPRFEECNRRVAELAPDAVVIDYGCAHGHFTNNFAKLHPDKRFIGIDVSPAAIKCARDKAEEWELENVEYRLEDWLQGYSSAQECDLLA